MKKRILFVFISCVFLCCKSITGSKMIISNDMSQLTGGWELNYISGGKNAIDAVFPNKTPQINFNLTTNVLSGNSGCNSFTSKVVIDGYKISISEPLAKTMMFCEGESESLFFRILNEADTYSVIDNHVLILKMKGSVIMKFEKKKI